MRKLNKGRKFSRKKGPRIALLKGLANNFFVHGKIKTTEAKAKELRPIVEKMITRGKTASIANRRLLTQQVNINTSKKVVDEISPMYKNRAGGYTRITRLGRRNSDGASMVILELVK
jgi:large subunit ribosomal protein L17